MVASNQKVVKLKQKCERLEKQVMEKNQAELTGSFVEQGKVRFRLKSGEPREHGESLETRMRENLTMENQERDLVEQAKNQESELENQSLTAKRISAIEQLLPKNQEVINLTLEN